MDAGYREFLADLLSPLGGVTMRRMFGGLGIYRDGVIFAVVIGEGLYFKADAETAPDFEAEGCGPFVYTGNGGRPVQMPYWRAPERLYDDPEEFVAWARSAVAAAARLAAAKAVKGRARSAARQAG